MSQASVEHGCAEFFLGPHDAALEVVFPDTVYHHTGGRRMIRSCQPTRERETPAGLAGSGRRCGNERSAPVGEHRRYTRPAYPARGDRRV